MVIGAHNELVLYTRLRIMAATRAQRRMASSHNRPLMSSQRDTPSLREHGAVTALCEVDVHSVASQRIPIATIVVALRRLGN